MRLLERLREFKEGSSDLEKSEMSEILQLLARISSSLGRSNQGKEVISLKLTSSNIRFPTFDLLRLEMSESLLTVSVKKIRLGIKITGSFPVI